MVSRTGKQTCTGIERASAWKQKLTLPILQSSPASTGASLATQKKDAGFSPVARDYIQIGSQAITHAGLGSAASARGDRCCRRRFVVVERRDRRDRPGRARLRSVGP